MASNKNQHFVPRCHLRPFTKDEAGAAINVFNLDRRQFFPNAPVKNQCSGDYFYGSDELLESAIQAVEGPYGLVLKDLRRSGSKVDVGHKFYLQRFWLFQYLRTEAASIRAIEMASDLRDFAGEDSSHFKPQIREAVQIAMRTYADIMSIVDDLKVCLVRNRTSTPFVTSDDPAILTNRWYLEDRRVVGRSFGLQGSGTLGLLPLSPRIACILYDGDVYSIQHQSGWVDLRRRQDVLAINQHQFLNCFANVFVHDIAHTEEVLSQYDSASSRRLGRRHSFNVALRDRTEGEYTGYRVVSTEELKSTQRAENQGEALFHSQMLHHKPTIWPSILRWRSPGTVYTNGTGLKYIRLAHTMTRHSHRGFWREAAR